MTIIEFLKAQIADSNSELDACAERRRKLEREIEYLKGWIAGRTGQDMEQHQQEQTS